MGNFAEGWEIEDKSGYFEIHLQILLDEEQNVDGQDVHR